MMVTIEIPDNAKVKTYQVVYGDVDHVDDLKIRTCTLDTFDLEKIKEDEHA